MLGLEWYSIQIEFTCDFENPETNGHPTERMILSFISKVFDSLGCLAHDIFGAKFLIEDIFKLQLVWDDLLPEEFS